MFKSLPDTLEEFANSAEKRSIAVSNSKKKKDEEVFKTEDPEDDDLDNFIDDDDEEEEEIVSKKKPAAKRASKPAIKPTAEAKKTKSESLESTEAEADATPKKKFK